MIKKIKFLGIVFSATVVLPFNLLPISCGKKVTGLDTNTKSLTTENEKQEINNEIKDFIKSSIYPKGDKSILVINELLESENFDKAFKKTEINKIVNDLDQLTIDLNNNENESKVELTNSFVVKGLKNKIVENCDAVSKAVKSSNEDFSAEFQEVKGKVVEVDENSLIFNLKKFSINQLLDDIKDEKLAFDSEQETKIANSRNLKIYNFSTDLTVKVNKNEGKKASISIKDLNLFVVLDRSQSQMLTEGITSYLQSRVEQNVVSIYLDGAYSTGKSNKKISEYFSQILDAKNYDLLNKNNTHQLMFYLAEVYLPGLIYKSYSQNEEKPIKVRSKELKMASEDLNLRHDGMEMTGELRQEINFLKFFGDQNRQRQISPETVNKITIEHFLNDPTVYESRYYTLGSGALKINDWNIRGFSINPININFKIYIMKQIFETEISNLRICLNSLLEVMSKSSIFKYNANEATFDNKQWVPANINQYTIGIAPSHDQAFFSELKVKYSSAPHNNKIFYDVLLNDLYENLAKEKYQANFDSHSNISCKFSTKIANDNKYIFVPGDTPNSYATIATPGYSVSDKTLDIHLVFNASFKIKLNDDLLVALKSWNLKTPTTSPDIIYSPHFIRWI